MFRDYLSVTGVLIRNSFRRNNTDKRKATLITLGIAIGVTPMLIIIGALAYNITPQAIDNDIFMEMIVSVFTIAQLAVVFFGLFSMLGYMFFSDDAEFLAALPMRKSSLFLSKFTMVYMNELLISFIILIPMLAIMGISASNYGFAIGPVYYIMMICSLFLMPFIPLVIVSLLAFPMMYVVSYFKKRAVLSSLVLILLFVGFMVAYMGLMGNFTGDNTMDSVELGQSFNNSIVRITKIAFFNTYYANAMLGINTLVNTLLFASLVIISSTISFSVSSMLYHKSVMAQLESNSENSGVGSIAEQKGKAKAFLIKDFKMLTRNPGFAFQSFMGIIISPIIVFFISRSFTMSENMGDVEGLVGTSPIALTGYISIMVIMLLFGTNFISSVAFTREGKFFYYIKYIPISYSQLIKGKLNFAVICGMVGVVLVTVIYAFTVNTNLLNVLLFGGALSILNYAFCIMGIYRDLRKPKLEWNNAQEAIKQNLNVMFPMLISSLIGILVMATSLITANFKNSFVSWLILWIVTYLAGLLVLVYYKRKLDNNYVNLIECIEP